MNNEQPPSVGKVVLGLTTILVVIAGFLAIFYLVVVPMIEDATKKAERIKKTQELVASEAKQCIKNWDAKVEPKQDAWGNDLYYSIMADKRVVSARVTSTGPDGEYMTNDDITVREEDFNKSRIAGEWLGKRLKEGAKGLADGLKAKPDFPQDD